MDRDAQRWLDHDLEENAGLYEAFVATPDEDDVWEENGLSGDIGWLLSRR